MGFLKCNKFYIFYIYFMTIWTFILKVILFDLSYLYCDRGKQCDLKKGAPLGAHQQETSWTPLFSILMKGSTNVTYLKLENHLRAGLTSKVSYSCVFFQWQVTLLLFFILSETDHHVTVNTYNCNTIKLKAFESSIL